MPKHSLEKKHTIEVLKWSVKLIYEKNNAKPIPTKIEIQNWVCNEFNITGLDFDEDVKTQYRHLFQYINKFAKWISNY